MCLCRLLQAAAHYLHKFWPIMTAMIALYQAVWCSCVEDYVDNVGFRATPKLPLTCNRLLQLSSFTNMVQWPLGNAINRELGWRGIFHSSISYLCKLKGEICKSDYKSRIQTPRRNKFSLTLLYRLLNILQTLLSNSFTCKIHLWPYYKVTLFPMTAIKKKLAIHRLFKHLTPSKVFCDKLK